MVFPSSSLFITTKPIHPSSSALDGGGGGRGGGQSIPFRSPETRYCHKVPRGMWLICFFYHHGGHGSFQLDSTQIGKGELSSPYTRKHIDSKRSQATAEALPSNPTCLKLPASLTGHHSVFSHLLEKTQLPEIHLSSYLSAHPVHRNSIPKVVILLASEP